MPFRLVSIDWKTSDVRLGTLSRTEAAGWLLTKNTNTSKYSLPRPFSSPCTEKVWHGQSQRLMPRLMNAGTIQSLMLSKSTQGSKTFRMNVLRQGNNTQHAKRVYRVRQIQCDKT